MFNLLFVFYKKTIFNQPSATSKSPSGISAKPLVKLSVEASILRPTTRVVASETRMARVDKVVRLARLTRLARLARMFRLDKVAMLANVARRDSLGILPCSENDGHKH